MLEPLAEAAARVNRLGDVRWMALGDMVLANHDAALSGDGVEVAPYARRRPSSPRRPARGRSRYTSRPGAHGPPSLSRLVDGPGSDPAVREREATVDRAASSRSACAGADDVDAGQVPAPAWRPWPKLRRAGTEMRDRALPWRPARGR